MNSKRLALIIWIYIFTFATSGCMELQGFINSNSQLSKSGADKLRSALIVIDLNISSGSELDTLKLNAVQALKHKLTENGVKNESLYITSLDLDPAKRISQSTQENSATHLLELNVASAEISRSRYEKNIERYNVKIRILEIKSKSLVWEYAADITPGKGGDPRDLAESILNSLRKDGLL